MPPRRRPRVLVRVGHFHDRAVRPGAHDARIGGPRRGVHGRHQRKRQRARELAQDHTADFSLAVIGAPAPLESAVQDEAHGIAAESLRNAFRHARASKIEVEITYDSSALQIRVRDDGIGIEEGVLASGQPGHWGLAGIRERARAVQAELKIWSRAGAGTEIELVIPAAIAYPRKRTATNQLANM